MYETISFYILIWFCGSLYVGSGRALYGSIPRLFFTQCHSKERSVPAEARLPYLDSVSIKKHRLITTVVDHSTSC